MEIEGRAAKPALAKLYPLSEPVDAARSHAFVLWHRADDAERDGAALWTHRSAPRGEGDDDDARAPTSEHTDDSYLTVNLTLDALFRYLQSKAEVEIWLYEQTDLRIRGRIIVRAAAHPLARSRPLPAALSRC